jgi:hypothetical protein
MNLVEIGAIAAFVTGALALVRGAQNWLDRKSKGAAINHTVERHDKDFDNIRLTQTEHSVKISHLEQTMEKHDARLSRIETPRNLR